MQFAQSVKQWKGRRSMTAEQLSRASGVPLSTLNKILAGVTEEPKLSVAVAIARALDCPLGSLLGEDADLLQTLSEEECRLIRRYRLLDGESRELLDVVLERELSRIGEGLALPEIDRAEAQETVSLPLYVMPVSAGTGSLLDDSDFCETITVRATKVSLGADYALRVSGHSMEPKFEEGDILLVKQQDRVEIGELGIFIADGESYFKRFTGKHLHSFNPAYADILIDNFAEFRCCGRVIGQMKRRRVARGA